MIGNSLRNKGNNGMFSGTVEVGYCVSYISY